MALTRATVFWTVLAVFLLPQVTRAADELHILTLGDWGIDSALQANGGGTRRWVSLQQKTGNHPSAVLLLGDNFYVKLTGADDPRFKTFFEDTYNAKQLNIPFYAVMGNHDYSTGDLPFEMEYAKKNSTRLKIPSRWYRLDLPAEKPVATILMLDSDAPPTLMKQADWDDEQNVAEIGTGQAARSLA